MMIAAEAGASAIAKMIARKVIVGCAVPIPMMMTEASAQAQTRAFAVRIVRSVVMVSVLGLDEEEEDEDCECCGDPESEVNPGEGDELLFHVFNVYAGDGEVVIQVRLLGVQTLGVAVELGERLALVLAGALQDSDCAFGFGELAFVLDDALHCESDVGVHVLRVLCDPPVEVVGEAAGLADFVLENGDAVVEAIDVGSDLVVVVDDCLDGGVAVGAACCAVAFGLGVGGGHGVSFLVGVGWVVRIVAMDFSTLFSGGSMFAAFVSVFFAGVSWYQAFGSKKAKKKAEEAHQAALEMRDAAVRSAEAAEERARQAEKSLKQMEQIVAEQQKQSDSQAEIASHLWRPVFELTWDSGDTYLLCNVTGESVEVLEVANLDKFFRCEQVQQVFRPGESLHILMKGAHGKPLPANLELRIRGVDEVVPVPIRR